MGDKTEVLDALLDSLMERSKARGQKVTASGTPTTNYMHGPGGIFGVAGLAQDVFSTRIQPRGLGSVLQARGSNETNPLYPYLTGQLADTGDNPDGPCDNCQTAGLLKSCLQTAQFGRYCYMTKELELNRLGQRINRGEFDIRLVNDPLVQEIGSLFNMNLGGNLDLGREVLMAMLSVGISFQNKLTRQIYVGNPVNNTNGGYAEFPGLDILISTGKQDAITGTTCPALDSDIKDFNYDLVCGSGQDIVEVVTYMFRYLSHNASRQGFNPVNWVIAMRTELFYEITACWPCSYLSYKCNPSGDTIQSIDATDSIAMRDAMRAGSYLLIDGKKIPVVEDDGIVEESSADNANIPAAQFASDIYFIPLSVMGGMLSTYFEYVDYSQGAMQGAQDLHMTQQFWTDGGRFLWNGDKKNWCTVLEAKIEPRIILKTPQLAGRIQNVRYSPLQHTRTSFPGDPYFHDGGVTTRDGPSYYSDWNLRQ